MNAHEDQPESLQIEIDRELGADAVYAKVEELSRSDRRRRRRTQMASGAVVGVGLVAAFVGLQSSLPADASSQPAAVDLVVAAPAVVPAAAPAVSPSADPNQSAYDAYFAAGYDYEDAVRLAKLWHSRGDIASVKAEAGRRLQAHRPLPFPATPNPPVTDEPVDPQASKQFDAYFAAGYDWKDAVKLAKLWKIADPSDAKLEAGKRLLAGQTLPIKP